MTARFHLWNEAGRWTFRLGSLLSRFGLYLCGLGGRFDAIADEHR